jgi:catechol 2,3-dioxygenase-like lactoylglutathione lyase family enzyme
MRTAGPLQEEQMTGEDDRISFYLVNINVRDLDRSVAFYEALGFSKVTDFELDDPGNAKLFRLDHFGWLRAAWMRLDGTRTGAPMLDLVQFVDPPPRGEVPSDLVHVGPCRLAFRVDERDLPMWQERLERLGVEFVVPFDPEVRGPVNERLPLIYFRDPDGTYLELLAMPKD